MCSNQNCIGIGYSSSMINVPANAEIRQKIAVALLGAYTGEKKSITQERLVSNDQYRGLRIAPWHFHPEHRIFDQSTAEWQLKPFTSDQKFKDSDGKVWTGFPPPNYSPNTFIEDEVGSQQMLPKDRWLGDQTGSSIPNWVHEYRRVEGSLPDVKIEVISPSGRGSTKRVSLVNSSGKTESTPRAVKDAKRAAVEIEDRLRTAEEDNLAKTKLIAELRAKVEELSTLQQSCTDYLQMQRELQKENNILKAKIQQQDTEVQVLQTRLLKLGNDSFFTYDDLRPEGRLGKYVRDYTFFKTFESNELFLLLLDYDDDNTGDGVAIGMRRYSKVKEAERKGEMAGPDMTAPRVYRRCLNWKTEYLVFSVYCRVGMTQRQIAGLFGVSDTLVSDIIYQWANFLNDGLSTMFPTPTRSQLLHAYPQRYIRAFGDARGFLNLDASEVNTQDSHDIDVHSTLLSNYKKHVTVKHLAGCDPIGVTFRDSVPPYGFPGSVSDSIATERSGILDCIPFGMRVEVDKGFLIENLCAERGIGCDRPPKKIKGQTQMSAEDTALTQKIGNTRIVIEQVNGGAKMQGRYFNGVIPILQLSMAPLLLRVCYLMQNFRPGYIQGHSQEPKNGPRPSRAEVRYYGGTDDGLVDVRPHVHLWGTKKEIERFSALARMHPNKTKSDLAEMVLSENWPEKEAGEHKAFFSKNRSS
jgi:hypothetical protein